MRIPLVYNDVVAQAGEARALRLWSDLVELLDIDRASPRSPVIVFELVGRKANPPEHMKHEGGCWQIEFRRQKDGSYFILYEYYVPEDGVNNPAFSISDGKARVNPFYGNSIGLNMFCEVL